MPDLLHRRRARLEALVERLIDRLNVMDGDADAEPDFDGEDFEESSAQALTLAPHIVAARRVHAGGRVHG